MSRVVGFIRSPDGVARRLRLSFTIAARLDAAERRVQEIKSKHGEMLYAVAAEEPGAFDRLTIYEQELAAALVDVDRQRLTLEEARRREAEADAASRQRLRESQYAAFAAHTRARDEAAVELSEPTKDAIARFRALTDKMIRATPLGTSIPKNTISMLADFVDLINQYPHEAAEVITREGAEILASLKAQINAARCQIVSRCKCAHGKN